MAMILQLIFALSTLISITGSSDVFGMVGDSVQLDIHDSVPESKYFFWVFNRTNNVLEYIKTFVDIIHSPGYEDRVEFNKETYSLTLMNLRKTDSGLYEAKAAGFRALAQYKLTVFDPAEAPVLTFQQSSDTYNITLACRGHDLSIHSSCFKQTCEKKYVTSPGGAILSLFVNGSSIICNHSNPVSWKTTVVERKQLCLPEDAASPGVSVCLLKTGLYSIILILMLSAVITVHVRERLSKSS